MSRMSRFGFLVFAFLFSAPPVAAQMSAPWHWQLDGNVFAGVNYQYRKFTDFNTVESQNWVMLGGEGAAAGGTLKLTSMLSLEPFTLKAIGSPQVFQTGETYQGAPLIDYQHPHDLFTNLGEDSPDRCRRTCCRSARTSWDPRRWGLSRSCIAHVSGRESTSTIVTSQLRLHAHHSGRPQSGNFPQRDRRGDFLVSWSRTG